MVLKVASQMISKLDELFESLNEYFRVKAKGDQRRRVVSRRLEEEAHKLQESAGTMMAKELESEKDRRG